MQPLTYNTLNDALVEAVPELVPEYRKLIGQWDGEIPGPYIVFGDILVPFVFARLKASDATFGEKDILRRIFLFLEKMALSDDEMIRDVVSVGVCEQISGESREMLSKARRYMLPETFNLSHRMAVYWGHEPPFPDDPPEIRALAPTHSR